MPQAPTPAITRDDSLGVIALVPDAWGHIVMQRHQVMRRLARYFPVVWMQPPPDWREFFRPGSACFLAPDRWDEPVPSLHVLSSGWTHPHFYSPRWLARLSMRARLAVARQRLLAAGASRIALYLWRDEYAEAVDLVEHDFSCYHIDDEYTFSDREAPIPERELALLQRVDQVIVHSPALLAKKGHINPHTAMVHNGVDFQRFSQPCDEPAEMAAIAHPRIGYAGVVKKQLDLALLVRLARARPHYSFVMVGPVMNVRGKEPELAALRALPNVHWVGEQPADELGRFMQHFDVCLMCYEVNDYTRYIYPLKLNEYLASGRPTVSAPIDAVLKYDKVVAIADSDEQWLAAIEQALSESSRTPQAVDTRRAIAHANDWDLLVERIADIFTAGARRRSAHDAAALIA